MTAEVLSPIVDGDAELRMLTADDLPLTLAWRNHPDSRRWFHSTAPIAPDDHAAWFSRYLNRADDYVFVIEVAGEPVAQVALYDIANGTAEFGRMLVSPEARGRGISHRATKLCLRVADEVLGLSQTHLEVKRDNVRAIRAYEAAGFQAVQDADGLDGSLVMRRPRAS
jgi:RimJ/RimL family protein N-acetyltransferase